MEDVSLLLVQCIQLINEASWNDLILNCYVYILVFEFADSLNFQTIII